jgi:hypothetical protein
VVVVVCCSLAVHHAWRASTLAAHMACALSPSTYALHLCTCTHTAYVHPVTSNTTSEPSLAPCQSVFKTKVGYTLALTTHDCAVQQLAAAAAAAATACWPHSPASLLHSG